MKRKIFGIGIIILFLLVGINGIFIWQKKEKTEELDPDYIEFITKEEMDKKGHVTVDERYRSEYSVGFNNKDGTKTVYVFSSPIYYRDREENLVMIDTRLKKIGKNENTEYIYESADNDIKTKFPEMFLNNNKIAISKDLTYGVRPISDTEKAVYCVEENFIQKKREMLKYRGMDCNLYKFYPSSLGVNCEVEIEKEKENSLSFYIDLGEQGGVYPVPEGLDYITLQDDNGGILGVIQKPLLKYPNKSIKCDMNYEINYQQNGRYQITFKSKETFPKGTVAFVSFEMRRKKQADNGIYSKFPDLTNNYLSNYIVVGKSNLYGIGKMLWRCETLNDVLSQDGKNMEKAFLDFYDLSPKVSSIFSVHQMKEKWCSIRGNWNKKYSVGEKIFETESTDSVIKVDLSNKIKNWIDSKEECEKGIVLEESTKSSQHIILSNDNSLFQTKVEILMRGE